MLVKMRQLWIQLTTDRRRFGALCAALGVGMLLWARLIVVSRMPRMAVADDAAEMVGKVGRPGTSQNGGEPTPTTSTPTASARVPVALGLNTKAARDPFVISPRYFPRPPQFAEAGQEAGKSSFKPAEDAIQIEARITAQLAAIAERLRLEAAVTGSLVVIGGKTYRVGDWVEGSVKGGEPVRFRLVEVRHRSAVLECNERRFEIQMTSPGG